MQKIIGKNVSPTKKSMSGGRIKNIPLSGIIRGESRGNWSALLSRNVSTLNH